MRPHLTLQAERSREIEKQLDSFELSNGKVIQVPQGASGTPIFQTWFSTDEAYRASVAKGGKKGGDVKRPRKSK